MSYHISNLIQYVDAQAQKTAAFASVVPELNEAISDIMSKAHGRKTRSQDAAVTPTPAPAAASTPAASASVPAAKAVAASPPSGGNGSSQKAEVLAQAA